MNPNMSIEEIYERVNKGEVVHLQDVSYEEVVKLFKANDRALISYNLAPWDPEPFYATEEEDLHIIKEDTNYARVSVYKGKRFYYISVSKIWDEEYVKNRLQK